MRKRTALWLLFMLISMRCATFGQDSNPIAQPIKYRVLESFPDKSQARLENRDRALKSLPRNIQGFSLEYVIRRTKLWHPGQTLRVAFLGGDATLRHDIAETAAEWSKSANIKLDFADSSRDDSYREWHTSDTQYSAEIRISFDQDGYWSFVGTDSVDISVTGPGEASMNFGGFDSSRPYDWQATVRHEFGHALGFEHEHQTPIGGCDEDFRWENDPGYMSTKDQYGQFQPDSSGRHPGLYTMLGGPPNYWPKAKVDANLRQIKESVAFFELSEFDVRSIMKYYFPDWMFTGGTASHCYSDENLVISEEDRKGAGLSYPSNQATMNQLLDVQRGFLTTLKDLQSPSQGKFELQMRELTPH